MLDIQKEATLHLLDEIRKETYEGYISELVLVEINRASATKRDNLYKVISDLNIDVLRINESIEGLADKYIEEGILPQYSIVKTLYI
jgi:rRNA-processing protein FCF1